VQDTNLRQSLQDGESEFLGSIDISYLGLDKLVGDNPGINPQGMRLFIYFDKKSY
jgi:hypothetical protein